MFDLDIYQALYTRYFIFVKNKDNEEKGTRDSAHTHVIFHFLFNHLNRPMSVGSLNCSVEPRYFFCQQKLSREFPN